MNHAKSGRAHWGTAIIRMNVMTKSDSYEKQNLCRYFLEEGLKILIHVIMLVNGSV